MGCNVSSSVLKQAYAPRSLKIITQYGKTFVLGFNESMRVADIKHLMEMRIGARFETLILYIRCDSKGSKDSRSPALSPSSAGSSNETSAQLASEDNDRRGQSHDCEEEVEMEDHQVVSEFVHFFDKQPIIYLRQVIPLDVTAKQSCQPLEEGAIDAAEQLDLQRNQSICLGKVQSEQAIVDIINRIENGEYVSHSQINHIQLDQLDQQGNNVSFSDIHQKSDAAPRLENGTIQLVIKACDLSIHGSSPKSALNKIIPSH